MSMPSFPSEVLARRRDRALAIVLGFKERECDQYLPRPVSDKLRKVVLDQVNELADLCADLIRSYEDAGSGVMINRDYLDRRLDSIESMVASLQEE